MKMTLLTGRIIYSLIFIMAGVSHFRVQSIQYAASQGVPWPSLLVPAAGLLAMTGGIYVALGWRARLGAWFIVAFLVPVTVVMHRFWGLADAQLAMQQQVHFLKNVSLLGGALMVSYFGAGPYSLDARRLRREVGRGAPQLKEPAEV